MFVDLKELVPHPLALLYDRDEENIPNLAASIAVEGMRDEIVIMGNQIVDGCRRHAAYQLAITQGLKPPGDFKCRNFNPRTDGDIWDFILAKNGQRRDRPRGQKALPILQEELRRNHTKSDRSISSRTYCHHTMVSQVRLEMEDAGEIPKHSIRVDARGGQQAAAKTPNGEPPPDAGDSWEPPEDGSEDAKGDADAREAGAATFDHLGKRLPIHLKDEFASSFYDDAITSLSWIAKHVTSDPKGYVRLHIKPHGRPFVRLMQDFADEAKLILEHHAPFCICPSCGGKEGGCADCFSTGWLSKGQYEEKKAYEE